MKKLKSKVEFYKIISFVIKKLNELGKNYIFSNKPFCKYHSIIYFEQSNYYFEKYFPLIKEEEKNDIKNMIEIQEEEKENRENISLLPQNEYKSLVEAHKSNLNFLRDINTGAILLCKELLNKSELINENLITAPYRYRLRGCCIKPDYMMPTKDKINLENQKVLLRNFEKILSEIQLSKEITKKEALCIANIIKIIYYRSFNFYGGTRTYLSYLAKRCQKIVEHLKLDTKEKWYLEFEKLYNILKELEPKDQYIQEILDEMKEKYRDVFEKIENAFNKKNAKEFIKFIIKEHPYKDAENDKNKNFDNDSPETLRYLLKKYLPDNYKILMNIEKTKLNKCIVTEISKKLNYFYLNIN